MPFTFKNYEINGAAAPALRSKNSPANPPHLTTAPLTVRKKSRMEEEENGHSIRFQSIMLLLSPRLADLYQLLYYSYKLETAFPFELLPFAAGSIHPFKIAPMWNWFSLQRYSAFFKNSITSFSDGRSVLAPGVIIFNAATAPANFTASCAE